MADETQGQDTIPLGSTDGPATGAAPDSGTTDDSYVGTFKTREDAEKGFENLQRMRSEDQSRADKLAAENAELRDKQLAKLTEAVTAGQENRDTAQRSKDADDRQAYWKQRIEEEPTDGVLELVQTLTTQGDQAFNDKLEAATAAIKAEYDGSMKDLQARVADQDPDYVAVRDKVNEYREKFGVDRNTAIAMAKEFAPAETRASLPGNSSSQAAGGAVASTEPKPHLVAFYKDKGYSDDDAVTAALRTANGKGEW